MASSIIFMFAGSLAELFAARALQVVATGAALSAASAALLDFHARRDAASVGLTNGVAGTAGMGLGVLASALLVALGPLPLVAPYALLFGLTLLALLGVLLMPEPVAHRSRLRLTPQSPSLPSRTRRPFRLAALGVLSSWSIAGLFFSLGPQLAATLFHSSNTVLSGFCIFLLAISGATSQLVFRNIAPWRGAALGSVALAVGMLLVTASAVSGSTLLYLAGTVIGGGGYGVAFASGLRTLSAAIPHEHRAAIMSAFYIVCYGSPSLPAIVAGAAVTPLGLRPTFALFGAVVALLALGVALEAWRFRPAAKATATTAA
jgi:MFS family permease